MEKEEIEKIVINALHLKDELHCAMSVFKERYANAKTDEQKLKYSKKAIELLEYFIEQKDIAICALGEIIANRNAK